MKNYSINIGKIHNIFNLINQPIRDKKQLDLLLLETLKTFITGDIGKSNNEGKIVLNINRMNRFIYEIENKIFSINCPFTCTKEGGKYYFSDSLLGIQINSKLISYMISIIKKGNINNFEEMVCELIDIEEDEDSKSAWELLKKLYHIEYGYIRYDYDKERENGKLHPLNHLDINFTDSNKFKLGLNKKITIDEFIDILDITTECYYLI